MKLVLKKSAMNSSHRLLLFMKILSATRGRNSKLSVSSQVPCTDAEISEERTMIPSSPRLPFTVVNFSRNQINAVQFTWQAIFGGSLKAHRRREMSLIL